MRISLSHLVVQSQSSKPPLLQYREAIWNRDRILGVCFHIYLGIGNVEKGGKQYDST